MYLTKKLTSMIKRTFSCLNRSTFLKIYKGLIRSTVDYGVTVWYSFSKKNIQIFENIQRRATRIVPDLKELSYEDRLRSLNLSTLLYRRQRYDQIQIFKIVSGVEDIDVDTIFYFQCQQYLELLSHQ